MKIKYKKRNSPRMQSAINRTFHAYVHDWFFCSNVRYLAEVCIQLAYGADKYDVLNALRVGSRNDIVTYARGDIRHRRRNLLMELLMFALALILILANFGTIG